tara:strand:+ start:1208 stop:1585 length:378 start_codon:yes stop_codon:yes gene_type:complete
MQSGSESKLDQRNECVSQDRREHLPTKRLRTQQRLQNETNLKGDNYANGNRLRKYQEEEKEAKEAKEVLMKGVKHYTRDGSVYNGPTHKMKDGKLHTGAKHTSSSKALFHMRDLSERAKKKAKKK